MREGVRAALTGSIARSSPKVGVAARASSGSGSEGHGLVGVGWVRAGHTGNTQIVLRTTAVGASLVLGAGLLHLRLGGASTI